MTSQSLCMACGLCCDGTLFGYVRLAPEDDRDLIASNSTKSALDDEKFRQPCLGHQYRACTLYSRRPSTCKKYRCELLKKLSSNEVSYEEARAIIMKTSIHANDVRESLIGAVGKSNACLDDLYLLVKKSGDPAYNRLLLGYVALQVRLDKHFGKRFQVPGEQQTSQSTPHRFAVSSS